MLTIGGLFLIVAVILGILRFAFKGVLAKRSSTEVMLLGLMFIITGGIFLIEPELTKSNFILSVAYGFVLFGFMIGILGFFKG